MVQGVFLAPYIAAFAESPSAAPLDPVFLLHVYLTQIYCWGALALFYFSSFAVSLIGFLLCHRRPCPPGR
jgi:hypothetical protein